MNKKELQLKLDELDIEWTPAMKKAELEALVPEEKSASVDNQEARTYTKTGQLVRVYSFEAHGEGFAELAKEFAKKKGLVVK